MKKSYQLAGKDKLAVISLQLAEKTFEKRR